MATAVTDIGFAIYCPKPGADDYICKPFNLDEVSLDVQGIPWLYGQRDDDAEAQHTLDG